jgi:hypothetical protein
VEAGACVPVLPPLLVVPLPPGPGCVAAVPPPPPPGCTCEPELVVPDPVPPPVVPEEPVGAGAAAAVVAGRLAQPVRATANTSNDMAMMVEHRVRMRPPFDLT